MVGSLVKSLGITIAISLLFGLVFFFTGRGFWLPVGVAFLSQIVLWFVIQYVADIYVRIKAEEIENDRIREISRTAADVECSFCGKETFIPIDLTIDNTFTCEKCGKENVVIIRIDTAQTTDLKMPTDNELLDTLDKKGSEAVITQTYE